MKMEFDFRLKISRKSLMTHAHDIARAIVAKVGDYRIALKLAMKYCWNEVANNRDKKRFTKRSVSSAVYELTHRKHDPKFDSFGGVYAFFIAEKVESGDIDEADYRAFNAAPETSYPIRETAKAVYMRFKSAFSAFNVWVPKAMLVN